MPADKVDTEIAAMGTPAFGRSSGAAFADRYRRTTGGTRTWLSVHLADGAETMFGAQLLEALAVIDMRLPGAADRFADELAAIRYVSNEDDKAAWKVGFEQLIQKLGEVLIARTLFEAEWPPGTTFALEPTNSVTGARPEILVDTPARQWLFEVKCPAFIDYQDRRGGNRRQLPVRGPLGDVPGMRDDTTLPRDNVLKDFLESAERKFRDFSAKTRTGLLVVLWDGYIFEITSALSHEHAGLLTEQSWHQRGGVRVPFDAVDGVIILNHLEVIKIAAQGYWQARQNDPFRIESVGQPPNVWCPNLGRGALDSHISQIFNARPLDEVAVAADYAPKDFVMWVDTAAAARKHRRALLKRHFLGGAAPGAIRR